MGDMPSEEFPTSIAQTPDKGRLEITKISLSELLADLGFDEGVVESNTDRIQEMIAEGAGVTQIAAMIIANETSHEIDTVIAQKQDLPGVAQQPKSPQEKVLQEYKAPFVSTEQVALWDKAIQTANAKSKLNTMVGVKMEDAVNSNSDYNKKLDEANLKLQKCYILAALVVGSAPEGGFKDAAAARIFVRLFGESYKSMAASSLFVKLNGEREPGTISQMLDFARRELADVIQTLS